PLRGSFTRASRRPIPSVMEHSANTPSSRPVGTRAKTRVSFKTHLLRFFTWWNGATLNTRFYTWRFGEEVGTDEFGNIYYRTRGGAIDPALGFQRRWVIYARESEASMSL